MPASASQSDDACSLGKNKHDRGLTYEVIMNNFSFK